MLFLMVETFPKDGIKIGLFPTEFIKKSFFEKCQKLDEIKWTKGGDPPPSVHLIIRGDGASRPSTQGKKGLKKEHLFPCTVI